MKIEDKYNNDDVYFRSLIIGLLAFLNNKLTIWHIKNGKREEFPVKFYFDAAGDERFLQDMYIDDNKNDEYCNYIYNFRGDHKEKPFVVLSLENFALEESSLTNRFVRGEFTKISGDGNLETFNAPMNQIPLQMNFKCSIHYDSQLESFKLIQNIIRTFYKSHKVFFLFENVMQSANVGMATDIDRDKRSEFTYGDRKEDTINFNIETFSFLPIIDETLEFRKDEGIESFELNSDTKYHNFNTPTVEEENIDGEKIITKLPNNGRLLD